MDTMGNLEPTFAADGYPTDETLDAIREWDYHDFPALMEFVAGAWKWDGLENKPSIIEPLFDSWYEDDGYWWCGATGGWSGNESLLAALDGNTIFAALCWRASIRGGYAEYHVRPLGA
jgi:hypothetical protein